MVKRIQEELIQVGNHIARIKNGLIQNVDELSKDEYSSLLRFLRLESPREEDIIEKCFKEAISLYGVKKETLFINSKKETIVEPRQYVMYLLRKRTKMSSTQVGDLFGKDHVTVLHAQKVIAGKIESKQLLFQISNKPKVRYYKVTKYIVRRNGDKKVFNKKRDIFNSIPLSQHGIRKALEGNVVNGYTIRKEIKREARFV